VHCGPISYVIQVYDISNNLGLMNLNSETQEAAEGTAVVQRGAVSFG